MMEDSLRQSILDEEHLKLLSLGYMVSAGVSAFFSLFGLFYLFMGVMMSEVISHAPQSSPSTDQPPPQLFLWLFGGIGLAIFLLMVAFAAGKFYVAFQLRKRQSRTLCLVIAAIGCLEVPYGTALGVFTFIVLGRPSVEQMFHSNVSLPPAT